MPEPVPGRESHVTGVVMNVSPEGVAQVTG